MACIAVNPDLPRHVRWGGRGRDGPCQHQHGSSSHVVVPPTCPPPRYEGHGPAKSHAMQLICASRIVSASHWAGGYLFITHVMPESTLRTTWTTESLVC